MTFPLRQRFPALTRKRLREIQQQYGDDPVVRRLLWEIGCLQGCHHVCATTGGAVIVGPSERATE